MNLRLPSRCILSAFVAASLLIACPALNAQAGSMGSQGHSSQPTSAAMPSPPATASVHVAGGSIEIHYNTPHMRGRKIMGGLVPYGKVWRTGANPATTIITTVPLKFGSLLVPAGTHTLFSLPSPGTWQLILSNDVGEWGLAYKPNMDLGRVPMKSAPMSKPQEVMSLSFEHTIPDSTQLHVRWETTDEYVTITKP